MGDCMTKHYLHYEDYWDAYLRAHLKPKTRLCHYIATVIGLSFGLVGLMTLTLWCVLVSVFGGYMIVVTSHFSIEKNKPMIHRPA